jgi:hypothetical protein
MKYKSKALPWIDISLVEIQPSLNYLSSSRFNCNTLIMLAVYSKSELSWKEWTEILEDLKMKMRFFCHKKMSLFWKVGLFLYHWSPKQVELEGAEDGSNPNVALLVPKEAFS